MRASCSVAEHSHVASFDPSDPRWREVLDVYGFRVSPLIARAWFMFKVLLGPIEHNPSLASDSNANVLLGLTC
jgi:hypothetical protein